MQLFAIRARHTLMRLSAVAAAAAAQDRLELAVGPEVVDAFDRHELGETGAGPVHATLDGADRAAADAGRFLIGEAGRAYQHEGLALVLRQLGKRGPELLELDAARLLGLGLERFRIAAIAVRYLAA